MAAPPGDTVPDPWAVLGLTTDADDDMIRGAYRQALRAHPPESDPEGFKRVRAAYEALRDPKVRVRRLLVSRPLPPRPAAVDVPALPAPPVSVPGRAELAADLRAVLLADTDLTRSDFRPDLRQPRGV